MAFKNTKIYTHILGGMDAGFVDAKISDKSHIVQNGVFKRLGSIDKRFGTKDIRTTGASKLLFSLDGIIHQASPGLSIQTEDASRTIDLNKYITGISEEKYSSNTKIIWSETLISGDFLIFAYIIINELNKYDTYVDVYDLDSKYLYSSNIIFTNETDPAPVRILSNFSGTIYVAWIEYGVAPRYKTINSSGVLSSTTTISGPPNASGNTFDVSLLNDYSLAYVYKKDGTDKLVVALEDGSAVETIDAYGCEVVSICNWAEDTLGIAFSDGDDIYALKADNSVSLSIDNPTLLFSIDDRVTLGNLSIGIVAVSKTLCHIWNSYAKSYSWPYGRTTEMISFDDSGTVGTKVLITNHGELLAKPFVPTNDEESWGFLAYGTNELTTKELSVVLFNNDAVIQGSAINQTAINITQLLDSGHYSLPNVNDYGDYFTLTAISKDLGSSTYGSLNLLILDLEETILSKSFNGIEYIPGSLPRVYTKSTYGQTQFLNAPIIIASNDSSGTALTSGLTYGYKACFFRKDALGNSWFGPMSKTSTFVSNGSDGYVEVSTTDCDFDASILVFRSAGESTNFYKVLELQNDNTTHYLTNNSDDITDLNIINNEESYTNNKLSYVPWYNHRISAFARNRYFIVPRNYEYDTIYYSNKIITGGIPNFAGLSLSIPEFGGKITGIIEYIDKIIVFKETAIYAIEGDGLESDGTGSAFRPAYLIDSSIGCINTASICRYGLTILFESKYGLYRIGSNFQPEPFGLEVKKYTETSTICNSHIITNTNEAVFMTDGYALVYNNLYNVWSVWDNHSAILSAFDGEYIWFKDELSKLTKTTNTYDDNGSWIKLKVITPWLSKPFLGYSRFKSLQIVGQKLSDGYIDVGIGYDFNSNFTNEPHYFNTSVLSNFDWTEYIGENTDVDGLFLKVWPSKTRNSAIRVSLSDREPDVIDGYEGCSFTGIVIETTPVQGAGREGKSFSFGG